MRFEVWDAGVKREVIIKLFQYLLLLVVGFVNMQLTF